MDNEVQFICVSCGAIDPCFIVTCRKCQKETENKKFGELQAENERLRNRLDSFLNRPASVACPKCFTKIKYV